MTPYFFPAEVFDFIENEILEIIPWLLKKKCHDIRRPTKMDGSCIAGKNVP